MIDAACAISSICTLPTIKQTAREVAAARYLSKQLEIRPEERALYSAEEFEKRKLSRLWETVSRELSFTSKEDFEKRRAKLEKDSKAPDLDQVAEDAWQTFRGFYKEPELQKWKQEAERKKNAYIEGTIEPIAKVHVAWMDSKRLGQVFRCQFDDQERRESYMDVFGRCIVNTQAWKPCRQSYVQWLKDARGAHYTKNNVLRALACNDKDILKKVKEAREIQLEGSHVSLNGWVSAFATFDNIAKQNSITGTRSLANVISELLGPLTDHMSECFDRGILSPVCSLLTSSAGGRQILGAQIELPALEAARYVDDHIRSANPGAGLAQRLNASEVQLIRAGIWDPKTGFTAMVKSRYCILELPGDGFKINSAGALDTTVITSRQGLKDLSQEKWRKATGGNVRWAMVASIFQTYNLTKLIRKYHDTAGTSKAEAGFQLALGCSGMACSMADLAGRFLKNLPDRHLYMGRNLGAMGTKYMGESLMKWAGRASMVFAVLASVPDLLQSLIEYEQGYGWRSFHTVSSAISGMGAAILLTCECPLVGSVCLIVFIASNIYLSITKQGKIEEWMKRCSFGIGSEKNIKYETMQQELDGISFAFE